MDQPPRRLDERRHGLRFARDDGAACAIVPGGALSSEREVVAVEALVRLGRRRYRPAIIASISRMTRRVPAAIGRASRARSIEIHSASSSAVASGSNGVRTK